MTLRVKICGITTREALAAADGADFLGFVFFDMSPRNLAPEQAAALAAHSQAATVAVTVDPSDALLSSILAAFTPDYIQLHGDESVARVRQIKEAFKIPVIKALKVQSSDDIAKAHAYEEVIDVLLFDARAPQGLPGGNGLVFDWRMLEGRSFSKPWFLSGGLASDNVEEAVRISGAMMVDVSSSLESEPGIKDPALVRAFIKKAKSLT